MRYLLTLYNPRQHEQLDVDAGIMIVGSDPPPSLDHVCLHDASVDAWQLQICHLGRHGVDCLQLSNQGTTAIRVNQRTLAPREECELRLPGHVQMGDSHLVFSAPHNGQVKDAELVGPQDSLHVLARPATVGGELPSTAPPFPSPSAETLVRWFAALGIIQRRAAGSPEFQHAAVRALVEPGGLDAGMLLVPGDRSWRVQASFVANPPHGVAFDTHLAELARDRGSTVYHAPSAESGATDDAPRVASLVAPVFDEQEEVVAVLYGSRQETANNRRRGIRKLEALWIQLLAETLTCGVVRQNREIEVARHRALLEQAFPPAVLEQLTLRPNEGLRAETRCITTLFADVFDSTSLTHSLRPDRMYQLLSDLLDVMTRSVQEEDGVIVDYYGDGLIAMWNAPLNQEDHALRASRAALRIQAEMRPLNERWSNEIGRPLQVGVGVHTGEALVGNSGSRLRLKYGPRGSVVHIASRIEKATRRLHAGILLSEASRRQLPPDAIVQRLGHVRLSDSDRPISLYALHRVGGLGDVSERLREALADYEWTLRLIEQGRLIEAAATLDKLSNTTIDIVSLGCLRRQFEESSLAAGPVEPNTLSSAIVMDLSTSR